MIKAVASNGHHDSHAVTGHVGADAANVGHGNAPANVGMVRMVRVRILRQDAPGWRRWPGTATA